MIEMNFEMSDLGWSLTKSDCLSKIQAYDNAIKIKDRKMTEKEAKDRDIRRKEDYVFREYFEDDTSIEKSLQLKFKNNGGHYVGRWLPEKIALFNNSISLRTRSVKPKKADFIRWAIKEKKINRYQVPDDYYKESEYFLDYISFYYYGIFNMDKTEVPNRALLDWKKFVEYREDGKFDISWDRKFHIEGGTIYYPEVPFPSDGNRTMTMPLLDKGDYAEYSIERNFKDLIIDVTGFED